MTIIDAIPERAFPRIFDWLVDYCEERGFRLTMLADKFHLVWVVNDRVRMADFEDTRELKDFVDNREAHRKGYSQFVRD